MGLYMGRLIIGTIFASEIWGAYFMEGLFLKGLREVVITRVLDEDPPCLVVGGLYKTLPI